MKKNKLKVELKKYLSQKEKIKNTFISSCIILVVLTFFIFITYSYFINKTGEIEVGNFNSSIPDVEIINKEIVKNTNNRQVIYTIKNNSSSYTYSYSLFYKIKGTRIASIFYKIPSKEYSHPEGIIKPNETKKIFLLSSPDTNHSYLQNDLTTDSWDFQLYSGYEYSKPKIEGGYQKINYSLLSETAELKNLNPSIGTLSPNFNSSTLSYELHIPSSVTITTIELTPEISNNGEIDDKTITISYNANTYRYNVDKKIKLYAEDGTYLKTYTISTIIRDVDNDEDLNKIFGNGKIQSIVFLSRNNQPIFVNGTNIGFEAGSTLTIYVPLKYQNLTTFKNCIIKWSYVDGQNFLYENNKDWYYSSTIVTESGGILNHYDSTSFAIPGDYNYYELMGLTYDLHIDYYRYGQHSTGPTYHIKFKTH